MLAAVTCGGPVATAQDARPEVDLERAAVIPVWIDGWMDRFADPGAIRRERMMVVDLGESWTPPLFPADHEYAPIYRAIARGEEPPGYHAWRAARDRYHEV